MPYGLLKARNNIGIEVGMLRQAKKTDWAIEPLPSKRTRIALDRRFSPKEMTLIQAGFVPEEMGQKWFIFWEDDRLFCHRSWSGFCVYIVHFVAEGDSWKMVRADVNRDPEQYTETDDDYDAANISGLIDNFLLLRW